METGFQRQRNRAHIFGKLLVHVADCFQGFVYAAKASHDSVTDGFHDGPMVIANGLGNDREMIPHERIGRSVADGPGTSP